MSLICNELGDGAQAHFDILVGWSCVAGSDGLDGVIINFLHCEKSKLSPMRVFAARGC